MGCNQKTKNDNNYYNYYYNKQQQLQQLQLQMQQIGGHRTASYYRYNCYSKKYIILYI